MVRQFHFLLIILALYLSSCKKVAYVDPPEFRPKLVIGGYLSPDNKENKIMVSSNQKRFGELNSFDDSFAPIGNVTISILEDSKEVRLDTIRGKNNYYPGYCFRIRNFQFKEGRTYTIKATSDLGLEAEAVCKIPFKRDFRITVDTTFRKYIDQYNIKQSILTAKISITDFPVEANYYRLIYVYEPFSPYYPKMKHFSVKDSVEKIPWNAEPAAWNNDRVKNDLGNDGKKFIIRLIEFQPVHIQVPDNHKYPDSAFLRIYLLNTDKHYYDFHRSLENASLGDAPFSEPSFFYSNVKGGLGLLASYTLDSLIFRIK